MGENLVQNPSLVGADEPAQITARGIDAWVGARWVEGAVSLGSAWSRECIDIGVRSQLGN